MPGLGKKPPMMAPDSFARMCEQWSKAALIDVLFCACQLGTDESLDQIATQAARNAVIVCDYRQDRVPASLRECAERRIDSD